MKALALVDAPDHVCCRYRVRAFQSALADAGCDLTIEGLAARPWNRIRQIGNSARFDVVLLQRKLLPWWQFRELRRRSRRLIFDFDDAVLYRDSYDPRGPHCRRRAARFARTVQWSDVVIAGNCFLAERARAAGAQTDRVHVVPTCIQVDRYPLARHERTAGVRLVWIGSSSTLKGLESREDLWERLGRAAPGVRLRMISDRFIPSGSIPIEPVPWNEANEAEAVAASDVGISWVPDDLWSRGKCGLKVLQYQAAGLPVVANPVGVHSEMVVPDVSGFLAESVSEWTAAVAGLAADPELRSRMGGSGRASVEARYSTTRWQSTFVNLLTGLSSSPGPRSRPNPIGVGGRRTLSA